MSPSTNYRHHLKVSVLPAGNQYGRNWELRTWERLGSISRHTRPHELCLFIDLWEAKMTVGPVEDTPWPQGNFTLQSTLLDPRAEIEQTAQLLNSHGKKHHKCLMSKKKHTRMLITVHGVLNQLNSLTLIEMHRNIQVTQCYEPGRKTEATLQSSQTQGFNTQLQCYGKSSGDWSFSCSSMERLAAFVTVLCTCSPRQAPF